MNVFDPLRPATARVWNHILGGKENFAADRATSEALLKACPMLPIAARESRSFLLRAVRYLTAEAGIRQFVDIGAGLPTATTVHGIAQSLSPQVKVAYVDHDPLVMVHARALLTGTPDGATEYIEADMREPEAIIKALQATAFDFDAPLGLLLNSVLHELSDEEEPRSIVDRYISALPSGSYVVLSHLTTDLLSTTCSEALAAIAAVHELGPFQARSRDEVAGLVSALDSVEPGLVSVVDWHPVLEPMPIWAGARSEAMCYAVVGTLP